MKKLLLMLLSTITKHPRVEVVSGRDFQWSSYSWVYNFFRLYEVIFGRSEGIRPESAADSEGNHYSYTIENYLVSFEGLFRNWLRGKLPKFSIVYIPQVQLAGLSHMGMTPYRFAIAFDNSGGAAATAGTTTISLTVSGSNTYLTAGQAMDNFTLVTATYNLVSMTVTPTAIVQATFQIQGAYLAGPATGTHNFVGTVTGGTNFGAAVISHSGVAQTAPDGTYTATSGGTSITININTATSNCWGIFYAVGNNGTPTASTNATARITQASGAQLPSGYDSNGTITTGGFNMTANNFSAQPIAAVGYSLATASASISATNGFFNLIG